MPSLPHAALSAVLLASMATAQFWTMGHDSLLRTRLDPIVSPGKVAGHVHLFSGSSAITPTMDHDKARAGCTTNKMSEDKSGYWTPQLYYKHRNGTYSAIDGDGMVIYWLYRGQPGEKVVDVPKDFRIVAGNTTRDFDDQSLSSHKAVSFECWGEGYGHKLSHLPTDFECENLRPQIVFPNCWNGVDSYKEDNSHVAHGTGGNPENGPCPAGFVRIATLFVENYYHPKARGFEWYPGSLVFSNGDNHGLTFHADWLNGFPEGMLEKTQELCPDMSANYENCDYLKQYKDEDAASKCLAQTDMTAMMVDEPIGLDFPLAQLPGNNPEFNSSREGNFPKTSRAGYVETAGFVRATGENGGVCKGNRCDDYTGPSGSTDGGAGAAPAPAPMPTSASTSSSATASPFPSSLSSAASLGGSGGMGGGDGMSGATSALDTATSSAETATATETETDTATATATATATGAMNVLPSLGQNLVAHPSDAPIVVPTGASSGADDEEELVCYRRKKTKRTLSRSRALKA